MGICEFLTIEEPVDACDVIFVLAGMPDRKAYGLELFEKALAARLILSVARFDVRATAALLPICRDDLFAARDRLAPNRRHFWIDMRRNEAKIAAADLNHSGTFAELRALAQYVSPTSSSRIALISTSIHLRRVGYCCSKIPAFANARVCLWAVPEARSSFRSAGWWKRRSDISYVTAECAKLLGYKLFH